MSAPEQTIYGLIEDMQDGSAVMRWFHDPKKAEELMCEETFYMNEAQFNSVLTFPTDLDLTKCGFTFVDDEEDI